MRRAEVLNIGTELTLGETVNTNGAFLARELRSLGFDVARILMVPDRVEEIAQAAREALERADLVAVTGGLGPTVDDPTRRALAQALERPLEFREDLWQELVQRYRDRGREPRENARRMAYLPQGGLPLANPVGSAPGFAVWHRRKLLIALPGVPREMEAMWQQQAREVVRRLLGSTGTLLVRTLWVPGVPEAWIDERLGDLEAQENPSLSLSCSPQGVTLRLMARAASLEEAEALLEAMEREIRQRLPWPVERDAPQEKAP